MAEDKTPTVTAIKGKPTTHMRLRLETVKRLRALGAKQNSRKVEDKGEQVTVANTKAPIESNSTAAVRAESSRDTRAFDSRVPRVKKAVLAKPAVPKAKFRKRQIHKSWLPTHLFHAKRAQMTPPSAPLWRFAIPLTPTQKCYRPTHRATHERGAVMFEASYMATICLEGREGSIESVLKGIGVGVHTEHDLAWGRRGENWRSGTRVLHTMAFKAEKPHQPIAPVSVLWCVAEDHSSAQGASRPRCRLCIRVHPSAFFQLWEEVLLLAKVAQPGINVSDLRFDIGSIEIFGPGSTEALLGALWPSNVTEDEAQSVAATTWKGLAGLNDPALLPVGSCLAFSIEDPRLHFPPRRTVLPNSQDEQKTLLELVSKWPIDDAPTPADLFQYRARLRGSKLPSQKAVNRRKSLAMPGGYPERAANDPRIPIILYTFTKSRNKKQSTSWILLAPWKAIQPIWYSLTYYPLSSGQQPRFGGLQEQQQLAFEAGSPWFPGDFPGTTAGWAWEVHERRKRLERWQSRPRGKRLSFDKVDLHGIKGEIGEGWACDWAYLLPDKADPQDEGNEPSNGVRLSEMDRTIQRPHMIAIPPSMPQSLTQLTPAQALDILKPDSPTTQSELDGKLCAVCISLVTRGVPQTCARIYRLPSDPQARKNWLALLPDKTTKQSPKNGLPRISTSAPPHIVQQRLAQSLLEPSRAGESDHPPCPVKEDLIGFVTTGNFNLAEGQGTAIGSLLLGKVVDDVRKGGAGARLCIVRNAGMDVSRLARWEVV